MIPPDSTKPKCAVLLAVYNGLLYIEEQIQSLLKQKGVDLTIFVSVDSSSDGSEAWLDTLSKQDSRILVLPHGKKFGGAAKNFFRLIAEVDFSSFDYIAFADQDDIWFADKLYKATTLLNASLFDAYSSNVTAFWPDGRQMLINKARPQKRWDYIFEAAGPGCTYVISAKLMTAIKSRMLEVWDLLQEVSLHDWYCYAFARANGYQWFIDPQPSMLYRQHDKNQVGVNSGIKAYINRFKRIKEGWWLKQASLIAELVGEGQSNFVQSWANLRRGGLLRLAMHAFQCRRQFKEQLVFCLVCILLAITGEQQNTPFQQGNKCR